MSSPTRRFSPSQPNNPYSFGQADFDEYLQLWRAGKSWTDFAGNTWGPEDSGADYQTSPEFLINYAPGSLPRPRVFGDWMPQPVASGPVGITGWTRQQTDSLPSIMLGPDGDASAFNPRGQTVGQGVERFASLPGYGTRWGLGWNDGTPEGLKEWANAGRPNQQGSASTTPDPLEAFWASASDNRGAGTTGQSLETWQQQQDALGDRARTWGDILGGGGPADTASTTYKRAYNTQQPMTLQQVLGTAGNYYRPGQPGYNVFGNAPGFWYNPASSTFAGFSEYTELFEKDLLGGGYNSLQDLAWVPWSVAPEEFRQAYGGDPKNITNAGMKIAGTGTIDRKKIQDEIVIDPVTGEIDLDKVLDRGFLGSGKTSGDVFNMISGRLAGRLSGRGGGQDTSINNQVPDPRERLGTGRPGWPFDFGQPTDPDLPSFVPEWLRRRLNPDEPGPFDEVARRNDPRRDDPLRRQAPPEDPLSGQPRDPRTDNPKDEDPARERDKYVPGEPFNPDVGSALGSLEEILATLFAPEFKRLQGGQPGREQALLDAIAGGRSDFSRYEQGVDRALGQRPDQSAREKRILDAIGAPTDSSRIRGELTTISQAVADELFGAGGEVDVATRGALSESVTSGFGPTSGGYTNARQNILRGGRDVVGRAIAQNAAGLAGLAVQERGQNISALQDILGILAPLDVNLRGQDIAARTDIMRTLAPLQTQERGLELGTLAGLTESQSQRLDSLRESLFTGQATVENLKLAREQQAANQRLINEAIKSGDKSWLSGLVSGGATGLALWGLARDVGLDDETTSAAKKIWGWVNPFD